MDSTKAPNKAEAPPAYAHASPAPGQPQYPAQAYYGDPHQQQPGGYFGQPPPQGGYPPNPQGGYYQQSPPMGYHQQGPYGPPPPGAYYGPQQPHGQYQDNRGRKPGCLEGMLAALACCCCLDILF